jgi:hypothetical protein
VLKILLDIYQHQPAFNQILWSSGQTDMIF